MTRAILFGAVLICVYCGTCTADTTGQESGQTEGEEGGKGLFGDALKKVGNFYDQNKGSILTALGLGTKGDGETEENFLARVLKQNLNLDTSMITNLTSSITSAEGFSKIAAALASPSTLPSVIGEQTGLSQESVTSYSKTIQDAIKNVTGSAVTISSGTCLSIVLMSLILRNVL